MIIICPQLDVVSDWVLLERERGKETIVSILGENKILFNFDFIEYLILLVISGH